MNRQGMAMPTHMNEIKSHIENDIEYPASKKDMVAACNDMSDVSKNEKEWFEKNLPDKTYTSADEVEREIGIT